MRHELDRHFIRVSNEAMFHAIGDIEEFIRDAKGHEDLQDEARYIINLVRDRELSPEASDFAVDQLYSELETRAEGEE